VSFNSYSTTNQNRRTLVQDLKYRFRIKAAQKHDLYEAASTHSVSSLSRVSVEDVRNIWIHTLIAETGLPSYKVDIPHDIVRSMERVIQCRIPRDKQGCINFEDFLPTIVHLIRVEVSPSDEEEIVNELFAFWSNNMKHNNTETLDIDLEELREKAINVVRNIRESGLTSSSE